MGEVGALAPLAGRLRHPVAPVEDLRGKFPDLARRPEVEGEAGAEDHPVRDHRSPGGLQAKRRAVRPGTGDLRSQHQPKPRIRRDPQHRITGRRDPLPDHVIEPPELLPVRKAREAVGEAGVNGLLHLVEPREGRSAGDQHHLGRPRLERRRRVVEGGRGEPDDRDPAAREGGEVDVLRAVPDECAQERRERPRHARRGLSLPSRCEDDAAGVDRLRPVQSGDPYPDALPPRFDRDHVHLVLDPCAGDSPVPVEIVRPDRRGDPAEPIPVAPRRLPPRPEGEPGHPQHRAREVLRRSQGLHAGVGPPRPLASLGTPVHLPEVRDPDPAKGERRREPAHASADDRDVNHPPPVRSRAGRDPVRRRVVQPLEVPREGRFQPRQSICSFHRLSPVSAPGSRRTVGAPPILPGGVQRETGSEWVLGTENPL